MQTLRSSVLIIAPPTQEGINIGADFVPSLEGASNLIQKGNYAVVVFPIQKSNIQQMQKIFQNVSHNQPDTQKILVCPDTEYDIIIELLKVGPVFKVVPSLTSHDFENSIQQAMEVHAGISQNRDLLDLVQARNKVLESLSIELETRVNKRQKYLETIQKKLLRANHLTQTIHKVLIALQDTDNIPQIESALVSILQKPIQIHQVVIKAHSQQDNNAQFLSETFTQPNQIYSLVLFRHAENVGQIYFVRLGSEKYAADEENMFMQISEVVALSLDRILKLQQASEIKGQWEATFNAISEPVAMITQDHNILRTNLAFQNKVNLKDHEIKQQKCYQVLFHRDSPCTSCKLGIPFQLPPQKNQDGQIETFEVSSHRIRLNNSKLPIFVNFYHDISEQMRLQRQILEAAKLAELGTIGSSIAHELNNPLGGMLTYLQMLKGDLKKSHAVEPGLLDDVEAMEAEVKRCTTLVTHLLGFTRKPDLDKPLPIKLSEIFEKARKIVEIKTKPRGIKLLIHPSVNDPVLLGHLNLLIQALCNLLYNSFESILEKQEQMPQHQGIIEIRYTLRDKKIRIEVIDNGNGILPQHLSQVTNPHFTTKNSEQHSGLGLTIASQIITEHQGTLDFYSEQGQGTTAVLTLATLEKT